MKPFLATLILSLFFASCSQGGGNSSQMQPPSKSLPVQELIVPVDPPVFDANSGDLSGTSWAIRQDFSDRLQNSSLVSNQGIATVSQSSWENIWATSATDAVHMYRDMGPMLPALAEFVTLSKATNGWIYMKENSEDTTWHPFAPAQVHQGDSWTLTWLWNAPHFRSLSGQWTITVVSTQAKAPNVSTFDAICLDISGRFTGFEDVRNGRPGPPNAIEFSCSNYHSVEYFKRSGWLAHRRTTYQCQYRPYQADCIANIREVVEEETTPNELGNATTNSLTIHN